MFGEPSAAMMTALQDFVFRHEIFIEAREFDDGFVSVILLKLLGDSRYKELLRIVRGHSRTARPRASKRRRRTDQ